MALNDPTLRSPMERYVSATRTSDLSLHRLTDGHDGRCDADVLLAAGYAASHDERGRQALMIFRMVVTGDHANLRTAIEYAYRWVRSAQAGRRAELPHAPADTTRAVVNVTMRWWLRGVCPACMGRRLALVYPGAQVTSARYCQACDGEGKVSLDKLAGDHWQAARWLASELDRLIDKIEHDMGAALRRRESI